MITHADCAQIIRTLTLARRYKPTTASEIELWTNAINTQMDINPADCGQITATALTNAHTEGRWVVTWVEWLATAGALYTTRAARSDRLRPPFDLDPDQIVTWRRAATDALKWGASLTQAEQVGNRAAGFDPGAQEAPVGMPEELRKRIIGG